MTSSASVNAAGRSRCRVGQRPPEPLAEAEPAAGVRIPGRPGRQQRSQNGDKAQAVQEEGRRHPEPGDEEPGDGGSDDARAVEDQGVEGDGVGQIRLAHQIGDVRLARRDVDGAAQSVDRGEDGHVPVLHMAAPDEQGQHERLHHHRRLGEQDDPPLGEAVTHGAADRRQDQDGGELQRGHEPELKRRPGELQHEPRLAHALHPGADERHELPAPEQPEVAVTESGQARSLRCRGLHALRSPTRGRGGHRRGGSWPQSDGQPQRRQGASTSSAKDGSICISAGWRGEPQPKARRADTKNGFRAERRLILPP